MLHDWRECTEPLTCRYCADEVMLVKKPEPKPLPVHTCTVITVDFKAKRVIDRKEVTSHD